MQVSSPVVKKSKKSSTPSSASRTKNLKTELPKDQRKLSSFFQKIVKEKLVDTKPELTEFESYFRPFCVKPDTIVASTNGFWHEVDPIAFTSSIENQDRAEENGSFC